jgi:hypothetical protein
MICNPSLVIIGNFNDSYNCNDYKILKILIQCLSSTIINKLSLMYNQWLVIHVLVQWFVSIYNN